MKLFVTGGAGFIGSNLIDRLLEDPVNCVVAYDNLSTGRLRFLKSAMGNPRFQLVRGDTLDAKRLADAMRGSDMVFHLAANADVRHGPEHTHKDLEQNTIATFLVLDTMVKCGVPHIAFSSTGSVYGDTTVIPTPEDAPFPVQTSLYGASKLAGEGLICAFSQAFHIQAHIFRFVSILGQRYSHGHVYDFVKQLRKHPNELCILGDGKQKKSYLHVQDCISAMLMAIARTSAQAGVHIYNLGTDHYCEVDDSAKWIAQRMKLHPTFSHIGGTRGWVGDNPFIYLDTSQIRALGWKPKFSIREGVESTVDYLLSNPWALKEEAS